MKRSKLRPPFKCHGGKFYLSDWVIENFPSNYYLMEYYELFGGAASVLLNKIKSEKETYNDFHGPTANIFNCMVNFSDTFVKNIKSIPYSESSFLSAGKVLFSYGNCDSAVAELVLRRMSRGGMKKAFSWSERLRGGRPGDLNAWETFKDQFEFICSRFKNVTVLSKDAKEILKTTNDSNNLIYLDPPYVLGTRTAKKVYDCELKDLEHEELASLVNQSKAKIIISGYDGPLYRNLYKHWNWLTKDVPNNSGQGKVKQRRVECLIKNY